MNTSHAQEIYSERSLSSGDIEKYLQLKNPNLPVPEQKGEPKNIWVYESDVPPENYLMTYVEDLRLLNATQNSMDGFDIKYLFVRKGDKNIFIVPIFYNFFKLGTMLQYKWLEPLIGEIGFKIACVGSPMMSYCRYEGDVTIEVVTAITKYLLKKASLVAFKGFNPGPEFNDFVQAHSMPVAKMHFNAEKWNLLRKGRNLSRKLKAASGLRYEFKNLVSNEQLDRIYELYMNTYKRADIQFGEMSKSYFQKANGSCVFILVYLDTKLVGFAQLFEKKESALALFLGMDYSVDKKVGLYFGIYFGIMNWIETQRIKFIEFGETNYEFKRKVGCEVNDCWLFYRHKNKFVHYILSKAKFLLEPTESEM